MSPIVSRRAAMAMTAGAAGVMLATNPIEARTVHQAEANKQVIRDLIEVVWRQGLIDQLPRFWTASCVNHADPAANKQGLEALHAYHAGFADWFRDFDDIRIDIEQQVAEADRVVTQITLHALHRPTTRQISIATIRIDRLEGGKIAEHWSIADQAGLMQQLA